MKAPHNIQPKESVGSTKTQEPWLFNSDYKESHKH